MWRALLFQLLVDLIACDHEVGAMSYCFYATY